MTISFRKLSIENFTDFELLTKSESGGGCYCSFWHQKWNSRTEWDLQCKTDPIKNRDAVFQKVQSGFHVGVLAYESNNLVGWISVGPLTDFYWTWRRMVGVGLEASQVAGIVCITIHPSLRKQGMQTRLLHELKNYGKTMGWKRIEGYPFDQSAIDKHGEQVLWPGLTKAFLEAGYQRTEPHWLNNPEAERSIFVAEI